MSREARRIRRRAEGLQWHLVTLPQYAAETNQDPVSVAIWSGKYADFPAPVLAAGPGARYYIRLEVEEWVENRRSLSSTFGRRRGPRGGGVVESETVAGT